jgi:hypothetical protein
MAGLFRVGSGLVLAAVVLAACTPPPPYEEVSDPFAGAAATLPPAAPVETRPLGAAPPAGAGGLPQGDSPIERAVPGGAPANDTVTQVNPGGLVERLPNTCQLENYQQFVGQDGASAAMQVVERPARVIAPDAIVSQVYDPRRVNLYVDGSGRVTRITCG